MIHLLLSQLKVGDKLTCKVKTHTMKPGDIVMITDINEHIFTLGSFGVEKDRIPTRFTYLTPIMTNEKIINV